MHAPLDTPQTRMQLAHGLLARSPCLSMQRAASLVASSGLKRVQAPSISWVRPVGRRNSYIARLPSSANRALRHLSRARHISITDMMRWHAPRGARRLVSLRMMVCQVDVDGSGKIQLDEFVTMLKGQTLTLILINW